MKKLELLEIMDGEVVREMVESGNDEFAEKLFEDTMKVFKERAGMIRYKYCKVGTKRSFSAEYDYGRIEAVLTEEE